jgi:hypothetical protein
VTIIVLEATRIEIGSRAFNLDIVEALQPVILDPADYGQWLDPRTDAEVLLQLLRPAPEEGMTAVAVSSYVSNARNRDRSVSCLSRNRRQGGVVTRHPAQEEAWEVSARPAPTCAVTPVGISAPFGFNFASG